MSDDFLNSDELTGITGGWTYGKYTGYVGTRERG